MHPSVLERPSRSARAALWWGGLLAVGALGCGGGPHASGKGALHGEGSGATVAVSDDGFPAALRDLLVSPAGSHQRVVGLAGVEARTMIRAVERYRARTPERGLGTVVGGLYLMRSGELGSDTLGPSGLEAVRDTVRELASHGDEGRARALYDILVRIAPARDRADAQAHLDALAAWNHDQASALSPMVAAGMTESVAVSRRLFEPSAAALEDAAKVTSAWIAQAVALREAVHERRVQPSREEVGEAVRAIQTGATVLIALYVRDADAKGALRALDRARARDLAQPELVRALDALGDKPTAAKWLDVLHAFAPGPDGSRPDGNNDEPNLDDRELLRAGTLGIALEAYRLDPSSPESSLIVAALLQELGMADASPAILIDAARTHTDARTLSGALAVTMRSMSLELEAEDTDGARRAYRAATPLLALGDKTAAGTKLQPTAARVRAMMGEIEMRDGKLDAARALLLGSANAEKSGEVLLQLARIDWHDLKVPSALDHLRLALSAEDTAHDPALRGEVLLLISDLTRQQGNAGGARSPLADALKELAHARNTPDADDRARVERVLSRVLDRFGAEKRAQQALDRAFEATPHDKKQMAATLGQSVARAFVRGDLTSARDGLSRALAAELDTDDLVYYALWVRLLERQLRKPTDGTPHRVFASIVDDGRWPGRLAAFGAGKLRPDELLASAKTSTQRTEALFYAAIDRRALGDAKGADDGLKQVVASSGVDLTEVAIARDLLAGTRSVSGPLPSDVALP